MRFEMGPLERLDAAGTAWYVAGIRKGGLPCRVGLHRPARVRAVGMFGVARIRCDCGRREWTVFEGRTMGGASVVDPQADEEAAKASRFIEAAVDRERERIRRHAPDCLGPWGSCQSCGCRGGVPCVSHRGGSR